MSDLIRREDVIKLVNQFVFGLCIEQIDEVRKTFNKTIRYTPSPKKPPEMSTETKSL